MKNLIKVAILSSIITAAMVYVILEWRPLSAERSEPPDVSWASSTASGAAPASAPQTAPPVSVTSDEANNIEIYQRYGPGVVNITTTTLAFDFFRRPIPQSGSGSGAIMDGEGHIVTNFHVVEGAQRLEVTLADRTKHPATVVGTDPNNDLAVIKINPGNKKLVPIPFGTSKGLQVGQKVLAIGNPFGLERTLTTGIISSLGRSIQAPSGRVIEEIIQTDAAINQGNSGGPLFNSQGQLIGINTAILSPTNGSIGIGFAIPVDLVRRITTDLTTLGYVRRPFLGIGDIIPLQNLPGLAQALRINTESGLMVVSLAPGGPAERAGIRGSDESVIIGNYRLPVGGDVILEFQGKPVSSTQELATEIDRQKPGDRVKVTVLRDNQRREFDVTLAEAPRN
jgi:putative serine protease PepD